MSLHSIRASPGTTPAGNTKPPFRCTAFCPGQLARDGLDHVVLVQLLRLVVGEEGVDDGDDEALLLLLVSVDEDVREESDPVGDGARRRGRELDGVGIGDAGGEVSEEVEERVRSTKGVAEDVLSAGSASEEVEDALEWERQTRRCIADC
ncbi:hypothetical protein HK101_005173 [Irineochytrium annulatum]|nr:hypothetical protein HK101_005173 [Irineochytrium annulatum]